MRAPTRRPIRWAACLAIALSAAACATARPGTALPTGNLARLQRLHAAPAGRYIETLLAMDLVASDVEWWVAGDPARLSWAGSYRGPDGIAEFNRRLDLAMSYDQFAIREYIGTGDAIAVVLDAGGQARSSGRRFASAIVRIYDFRHGRIARVRSYYDTAAYLLALHDSLR